MGRAESHPAPGAGASLCAVGPVPERLKPLVETGMGTLAYCAFALATYWWAQPLGAICGALAGLYFVATAPSAIYTLISGR